MAATTKKARRAGVERGGAPRGSAAAEPKAGKVAAAQAECKACSDAPAAWKVEISGVTDLPDLYNAMPGWVGQALSGGRPAAVRDPRCGPGGIDWVCLVCGCTEDRACPGGCSWHLINQPQGLGVCSACAMRGGLHRVLAIDPSITRLGWAVLSDDAKPEVEEHGWWSPSQAKGTPDRWRQLADLVGDLILEFCPTDIIIETPGKGQRHGRGGGLRSFDSLMVAQRASGICQGVASVLRRTWSVDPSTWKPGGVRKGATARLASIVAGEELAAGDEADAIGLAMYWYRAILPVLKGQLPVAALPRGLSR